MDELGSPTAIVALVGCVAALAALGGVFAQWRVIRRLRADQMQVLGSSGEQDLVAMQAARPGIEEDIALIARRLRLRGGRFGRRSAAPQQKRADRTTQANGRMSHEEPIVVRGVSFRNKMTVFEGLRLIRGEPGIRNESLR